MTSTRAHLRFALFSALGIAALYLGLLHFCADAVVADGYDGVGFILSLSAFDLGRFQPQPPGYPLFVLAGRMLHFVRFSPKIALILTSSLLLAAGLGALAAWVRAVAGWRTALLFLLLVPTAPLTFGLGMATLSDGAGLGMLLLAVGAGCCGLGGGGWRWHALAGLCAGLAMGLRPPLLPLAGLTLGLLYGAALRRGRAPFSVLGPLLGASAGAVLLWLVPLAGIVGVQRLWQLTIAHGRGHFTDFGGSALVDAAPLERLRALASGLYHGSVGPWGWVMGAVALLTLLSRAVHGAARSTGPVELNRHLPMLTLLLGCYGLFVLVALPVTAHGRHLLPLVVGLGTLGVMALASLARVMPQQAYAGIVALAVLVAVDSTRTVWAFRASPPPGAQLARFVAEKLPEDRLYGARAARYLDLYLGSGAARPAMYLGEVLATLARESNLPPEVLITSEVLTSPGSRPRLRRLASFCYPETVPTVLRFDRAPLRRTGPETGGDCVELLAYRVRP